MRSGRRVAQITALWLLALSLTLVQETAAVAGTDDYPTAIDGCRYSSNPGGSAFRCNLRDSSQDYFIDPWNEYNRECTSFVAWRLSSRQGFEMPFHGNASEWKAKAEALKFTVDSTPKIGAVAWWDKGTPGGGSQGHVAWVESVNANGTVNIEEYNFGKAPTYVPDGTYGTRTIAADSAKYIHFKDLGSGVGSNTKKDLVVYNPNATWAVASSNGSSFAGVGIGLYGWGRGDWTGLGDVNGDGFDDIVVHNPAYARFDVALNNKSGSFTGGGTWLSGWGAGDWAALGDLNGDKKADLVVHNPLDNSWSVAVSNGSSFAGAGIGLYGWGKGDWAGLADVTGDSKADIVVHDPANARYAVAVNNGSGQFNGAGTGAWLNGWGAGEWVGLGDINKDNRADLVVYANATWSVASSTGGSFAGGGIALSGWGRGDWTSLSDVTGDGAADIVIHNPAYARFDVAVNNGTGGFGAAGTGTWLSGWGVGDWAASGNVM